MKLIYTATVTLLLTVSQSAMGAPLFEALGSALGGAISGTAELTKGAADAIADSGRYLWDST